MRKLLLFGLCIILLSSFVIAQNQSSCIGGFFVDSLINSTGKHTLEGWGDHDGGDFFTNASGLFSTNDRKYIILNGTYNLSSTIQGFWINVTWRARDNTYIKLCHESDDIYNLPKCFTTFLQEGNTGNDIQLNNQNGGWKTKNYSFIAGRSYKIGLYFNRTARNFSIWVNNVHQLDSDVNTTMQFENFTTFAIRTSIISGDTDARFTNFTWGQNVQCFNFTVDLVYPSNRTVVYLQDNKNIIFNFTNAYNKVTCAVNSSLWNKVSKQITPVQFWNNSITLTNTVETFNTGNNYSLIYSCNNSYGTERKGSFWFVTGSKLNIFFYDEKTETLLNTTNINVDVILDLDTNNYTTSNGSLHLDLNESGVYRIKYTATDYTLNDYYQNINYSHIYNLNLYLSNTNDTSVIQYYILSSEDHEPIDGATVTLYKNIGGSYVIVAQSLTDFVGSVLFDQLTTEEYRLQIAADGYVTKTTNAFIPSITNSPYTIFVDLESATYYYTIFDFVKYYVRPESGVIPVANLTINFTAQSSSNDLIFFNWSTYFYNISYSANNSLAGGGIAQNTIPINDSHRGMRIHVNFQIRYDGDEGITDYFFVRTYYVTGLNKTSNITLDDTIRMLSDEIDDTEENPAFVKIVFLIIVVSLLIFLLFNLGLPGKFSAGVGIMLLLPAAHYGFIEWFMATLANLMYFFYIFMTTRDF